MTWGPGSEQGRSAGPARRSCATRPFPANVAGAALTVLGAASRRGSTRSTRQGHPCQSPGRGFPRRRGHVSRHQRAAFPRSRSTAPRRASASPRRRPVPDGSTARLLVPSSTYDERGLSTSAATQTAHLGTRWPPRASRGRGRADHVLAGLARVRRAPRDGLRLRTECSFLECSISHFQTEVER